MAVPPDLFHCRQSDSRLVIRRSDTRGCIMLLALNGRECQPGYQEDDVPTYVYACTECNHGFEAQQAFSDDALTTCPECGGKLRKVFNSVGIVFKGSGFYRNDSRGSNTSTSSSESTGVTMRSRRRARSATRPLRSHPR